jgi:hypothetical protein
MEWTLRGSGPVVKVNVVGVVGGAGRAERFGNDHHHFSNDGNLPKQQSYAAAHSKDPPRFMVLDT